MPRPAEAVERHDALSSARTPPQPAPGAARVRICFARTELGDQQVRYNQPLLPLHMGRLLLLFEGPQTVDDLRRMIDEPWLPEALIELERRRLLRRVAPPAPNPLASMADLAAERRRAAEAMRSAEVRSPAGPMGTGEAIVAADAVATVSAAADTGESITAVAATAVAATAAAAAAAADHAAALQRRRSRVRAMFLRQLGVLGGDMARRIDQCRSEQELDELMPQVDALIEALAGRDALGQFRQQTTRSH
ncbi:MAG: hypothetical protein GX652_02890 [Burkholderiaceae bacterium]|nr:hypothetical protein [Burkholderiaceae bacterium]